MKQRLLPAVAFLAASFLVLFSCRSSAHEVPSELTVETFIKPSQSLLRVLIRVPLSGLLGTGMPKEGVGYLALDRIGPSLNRTALQIANAIDVYESDSRLANPQVVQTRIALPFDTSFASYNEALAHLNGPPLPVDTQVYWLQGYFDALLEYPIRSEYSSFSFHARLMALAPRVTTSIQFLSPGMAVRSFRFVGDAGRVWLDPRWYQSARVFLKLGFLHVLGVWDQWMFLLCILVPSRAVRSLVPVIGSFAAAYSLTSLVIAFGPDSTAVWLAPLVDTVTAGLLVYLALENIAARRLDRRWRTTVMFGVVSGIQFSIAMRQFAQLAGRHFLSALLSFDGGVALGEVLVLVVVAVLFSLLARVFVAERMRTIILSAMAANLAWSALMERARQLPNQQWPLLTPATMVTATSWLLVLVVAGGCLWLVSGFWTRPPVGGAVNHDESSVDVSLKSTGAAES